MENLLCQISSLVKYRQNGRNKNKQVHYLYLSAQMTYRLVQYGKVIWARVQLYSQLYNYLFIIRKKETFICSRSYGP